MDQDPNPPKNTGEAWEEVGRQFKSLGGSIAQALRIAWEREENQRRLEDLRNGLESMVSEVGQAINETAKSPQAQRVKEDATRTAKRVQDATEQTIQDVRPHISKALAQLDEALRRFSERTDQEVSKNEPPQDSDQGGGI